MSYYCEEMIAATEARRHHRQLHNLFLKNWHSQGSLEGRFYRVAGVGHQLFATAPIKIGVHHVALNRARSHNCNLNHQIIITSGSQSRQHAHLGTGFDLKHTHRIRLTHHVIDPGIFGGDFLNSQRLIAVCTYQIQALLYRREHA